MNKLFESMNKSFESKYGNAETGFKTSPKTKPTYLESYNKYVTLTEKTTPEDREKSNKLKDLARKLYYGYSIGEEDKKFIDDLGFEIRRGYVVPKGTPEGGEYTLNVHRGVRDNNTDATGILKKLQRMQAGTSNPHHGVGRSSGERERLSKELDYAAPDSRSAKILQTKLGREEQRLKDLRRNTSYLNTERAMDSANMKEPINKLRRLQRTLDPRVEDEYGYRRSNIAGRRADIEDRKAELERDYQDRLAALNVEAEELNQRETQAKAEKDRLLRRGPKNESLEWEFRTKFQSEVYKALKQIWDKYSDKNIDYVDLDDAFYRFVRIYLDGYME